ncbi:spherulation-specific family 4 protein [Streptomyces sp. NPDC002055]|uniref:spherulation-specific family 4 protein n=1 Tax=Streptomyces sp. NPDC002055 TaxID=3154534 RepID=UPI00332982D8
MSHLISTGRRRPGAPGGTGLGFGVPGYAHPLVAPVEWAELTRPGIPLHWAVLDVDRGPGMLPDPHCLEAAGRLTNAGVRVLGHLDLRYGTRAFGELVSEAHRFVDWYKVAGFSLQRCPSGAAELPETRRLVITLRALLEGAHVVSCHGGHPHQGYAHCADQLVTFSGPWSEYRWSQVAEWTAEHPPERFCHLVHGVPRTHLEEAMRIARWQGAGTIYFTDRTDRGNGVAPWEALPGYWDDIVSRIGPGVSE